MSNSIKQIEIENRRNTIYDLLVSSCNSIKIESLVERLGVTRKTIERDLQFLRNKGIGISKEKVVFELNVFTESLSKMTLSIIAACDKPETRIQAIRTVHDIGYKRLEMLHKLNLIEGVEESRYKFEILSTNMSSINTIEQPKETPKQEKKIVEIPQDILEEDYEVDLESVSDEESKIIY